jgi:hypothetical protein
MANAMLSRGLCLLLLAALVADCKKSARSDQTVAAASASAYREVIPEQKTEAVRARPLTKRDSPVGVGSVVPKLDRLPSGKKLVLVFYRGHW